MADEPNIVAPIEGPAPQPAPAAQPAPAPAPAVPATPAAPAQDGTRVKEQFEKLLESNRRLFEANELLRQEIGQRKTANPAPVQQPVQQQPAQVNTADFIEVDPETGERVVNETKLNNKLTELNELARRADQRVESYIQTAEQREVERQEREAFMAHPELNRASEHFDYEFHKQTRAILIDSLVNPQDYGGKSLQFKEAADLISAQRGGRAIVTPAAQVTPVEAVPNENAGLKEQASASVPNQPFASRTNEADTADLRDLQMATRLGSDEALARRLVATDHTFKDSLAAAQPA